MKLYQCSYNYETPLERGTGKMCLIASDDAEAELKAKMVAGADSRVTNCKVSEVPGGFIRMGHNVLETEIEIAESEKKRRQDSVAQRFTFEVAAMAEVVATDRWDAYKKLAWMTKQTTPPPGLKRKVVSMDPVNTQSNFDRNAQYRHTRTFQGGKAGGG